MKLDELREQSKLATSKYLAEFQSRYADGAKVRWLHQGKYIQEGVVQRVRFNRPELFVRNNKTGSVRWVSDHYIIFD
jgi:hypothetical protein